MQSLQTTLKNAIDTDPGIFDDLGSVDVITEMAEKYNVSCAHVRELITILEAVDE